MDAQASSRQSPGEEWAGAPISPHPPRSSSTGLQNKLRTTVADLQNAVEGLQYITVLCSGLFLPERKHLKNVFQYFFFFLPVYSMSPSSHTCSMSAQRPQGGGTSSRSPLVDPVGDSLHRTPRKATSGHEDRDKLWKQLRSLPLNE